MPTVEVPKAVPMAVCPRVPTPSLPRLLNVVRFPSAAIEPPIARGQQRLAMRRLYAMSRARVARHTNFSFAAFFRHYADPFSRDIRGVWPIDFDRGASPGGTGAAALLVKTQRAEPAAVLAGTAALTTTQFGGVPTQGYRSAVRSTHVTACGKGGGSRRGPPGPLIPGDGGR